MASTAKTIPLLLWIAPLLIATIWFDSVDCRQSISKPRSCDSADTWFRHNRRYLYSYEAMVDFGLVGTTDDTSGYILSCDIEVFVAQKCESTIELSSCKLREKREDGNLVLSPKSTEVARDLERSAVYVQMDKGQVIDHQIVVDDSEPVYVTNIKRAIVSQLQLYILPPKEYDAAVEQHDIFGSCQTRYTFSPDGVTTWRDVTQCDVPQVFWRLKSYLSLARQIETSILSKPLNEWMYPFQSEVECTYNLGNDRKIDKARCVQVQAFIPITIHGHLRATAYSNITQFLTSKQVSKIPRLKSVISRGLQGRKIVDLSMEFELPPARDVTSADLFAQLQSLLTTYTVDKDALPPERFWELVDVLRDSTEGTLMEVLETLMKCRGAAGCPLGGAEGKLDPTLVQKLRESMFTDGLLSCGTESCVVTYLTSLQRGLENSIQGELSLFNMALFYQPTPAVLTKMLDLCKSRASSNCWLTLGTFVNKMAEEAKVTKDKMLKEAASNAILDVLQYLRVAIGDTCRPGILPVKLAKEQYETISTLLTCLKTLGNAGGAIQEFHDDVKKVGKDLIPAILHCIENLDLPDKIPQAAIWVLRKVVMRKDVRSVLSSILADVTRPASLRTVAFDLLLGHEHVDTVRALLKAMQTEKLSSFQQYMVTRVGHVLQSNAPHTASLRALWRKTMKQETIQLPELENFKGRGSQYVEISRYVALPPMGLPLGAELGLRVVFDPSSVVPSTVRVAVMATLGNHSAELIELGLDIQGIENIARTLLMSNLDIRKDGPGGVIAKIMQATLPRKEGTPTFFFPEEKVVESLKNLFLQVNMPAGDIPQAQLQLRVLGRDAGFIYLEDLIMMVMQSSRGNDKSPPQVMTLMQQLAQGFNLFVGKSLRMVEIDKSIPTVAGFPWQAKVHGVMVASAVLNASSDITSFLKHRRPLEIKGGLRASVAVKVLCQKTIRIGDATSSGVRLNISVLVNGMLGGRMQYASIPESNSTPGAQQLEMGLSVPKQPLNVARIRTDVFLLHNGDARTVVNPASEIAVNECAAEAFERWTGQRVCLKGFYQPISYSPDMPFPPLSGPIHLDVIARPADKSLQEYTVLFTLIRKEENGQPGTLVVFKADHSATGEILKRHFNISLVLNTTTKEVQLEAVVPEIGLRYDFDLRTTYGGGGNTTFHGVSSILALGPRVLHSFISQFKDEVEQKKVVNPQTGQPINLTVSERLLKVNVSLDGLSVELVTNSSCGKPPGRFSQNIAFRYYCEPELGIFYALHLRPDLAAKNGHVSEFTFTNEADVTGTTLATMTGVTKADFWRVMDTMVILIPGHNVTLLNKMAANYSFAERDTTIYWTSEIGTPNQSLDIIRMDAEVSNRSVDRYQSHHYRMDLDHANKYHVILQGSLEGVLSDLDFHTHVVYKAKPRSERRRRSLRGFFNRLKSAEEAVEETIVSMEEAVLRRGAELTEAFVAWMAGESSPDMAVVPPPAGNTTSPNAGPHATAPPDMTPQRRRHGALLMLFSRPEWTLDVNASLKMKPVMESDSLVPMGYGGEWDLNITLPDMKKHLLAFNGSVTRKQGWDIDVDGRLHTEIFNFTLDFDLEQRKGREWPLFFHKHQWNLVEFTEHRFDRSFLFKFDLKEHCQMEYMLDLVSPRTNFTHAINFKTVSPALHTVRANMKMHNNDPPYDINYVESSNVTSKGLKTDVSLNSTWLDLKLGLEANFSTPGVVLLHKHVDMLGKVYFLNGSRQVDFDLKLDPRDRSSPPYLLFVATNETGYRFNVQGQLLKKDQVLFIFSTRKPEAKENLTALKWNIKLAEPTILEHQLTWDPKKSGHVMGRISHFVRTGAHSLRHFGRTMATNVHKNISDMIVPFTNLTVSGITDRVVAGKMKTIAMRGLDPRQNVPLSVKVMKGWLKVAQALQSSWANSRLGKVAHSVGAHKVASYVILATTGLPRLLVEDPPFFIRQYAKFHIHPKLAEIAATGQFYFSNPLPFVWDSYLSIPRRRMITQQMKSWIQQKKLGAHADLPFMAIIADNKIQTFDGTTFDISMPGKSGCTYLLATDFVRGNHSLLLSPERATMVTPLANVAIGWDGTVTVNDNTTVARNLPANLTKDQSIVRLMDGQLSVTVPGQLRLTFDPNAQIYVIETARHVHNRSLGLLGTMSRDPGDDFRLPDGKLASDLFTFQQAYELSKERKCQNVTRTSSAFRCGPTQTEFCDKLFKQTSSPLSSCYAVVNPSHFNELCLRRVCSGIPPKTERACPIVKSYKKLCENRADVKIDTKTLSEMCNDCAETSDALDVVVGVAMSQSGLDTVVTADIIRNLTLQLDRVDARFGVVHSEGRAAHAHLFDGELFVTAKRMKSMSNEELGRGGVTQLLEALVRTATNYPFRVHARRLLVMIVDDEFRASTRERVEALQQMLWEKDMTLVLVADDKELDEQGVMAATWDQQIFCKRCDKDDVSLPETKVGELAQTTHVVYLSLDFMEKGKQGQMKKLKQSFLHIAKQPSPRCVKGGA